ncbi:MAG: ammonium transporter [Acidobacteriaceae bacterium]|nr:ammonium transporter [Acidobacteriaceae bacterium]
MTSLSAPVLSEATAAFCFFCILLIPSAAAGLAVMNAGLGRSRSVAHSLLSALCVIACAGLTYFTIGFAWQGYLGRQTRVFWIDGKAWSWIGSERFLLRGIEFDGSAGSLAVVFGMFAVQLAAIIPLGAAAERWRLRASCTSTILFAGLIYPLFAHWTWGGGWLAQLGINYHLGRGFIDSGGASSIQAVGGLTALAIAWIVGPRRGKFQQQGIPTAMPAHNAAFVLFGCFLVWLGYLAIDCAGAILFNHVQAGHATLIPVNVTLAGGSALLAASGITQARFGKVDASLCANAWVAGLAASAAGCAVVRPAGAVLIGLIGGALLVLSVEWLELYFKLDDPGGAISVHGLGGLWGTVGVGLFAPYSGSRNDQDQWLAQVVGIATLIGFVLPVAYGLNWALDKLLPQRVTPEGERQGLDLYELGTGAYPDFMTHNDEY